MQPQVSFGDRVRIRSTPTTQSAGLAGLIGSIYGETVPSVSGVDVIGQVPDDYAVNVFVEDRQTSYWLAPEHVDFLSHDAGQEIRLSGATVSFVRRSDGSWEERPINDGPKMRRSRARLPLLFLVSVGVLSFSLLAIVYVREAVQVDSCLDAGGSYDYVRGACDHAAAHRYIPFLARHGTLVTVTLLASAAAVAVAFVAKIRGRTVIDDSTV